MRRVRLTQDVRASFSAGTWRGEGLLYNVSHGGFFVYSPTLLRPGTRVKAVFRTVSGGLSKAEGQVCWNTAEASAPLTTSGFGVRLLRADEQFRCLVEAVLGR